MPPDDSATLRAGQALAPQGQVMAPISPVDELLSHPAAKFARGVASNAYGLLTAAPRAAKGMVTLLKDGVNYVDHAVYPRVSPLTGEVYGYQPESGFLREIQQQGLLGTAGSLLVNGVRNAPGIGLIGALGKSNRDWEEIGKQAFNTALVEPTVWDYYRALPVRYEFENGYTFGIDRLGRTVRAEGLPTVNREQIRNRQAQADAGGADRLATDHGGHLFARVLDGPLGDYNYFAQDANFNLGAYAAQERVWRKAIEDGTLQGVYLRPKYRGTSLRPYALDTGTAADFDLLGQLFYNRPGGK